MAFKITVVPEVAALKPDSAGTRRRTVELPDGSSVTLTFSRHAVYLPWLPEEISSDAYLRCQEITPEAVAAEGGIILANDLKSERVEEPEAAALAAIPLQTEPPAAALPQKPAKKPVPARAKVLKG